MQRNLKFIFSHNDPGIEVIDDKLVMKIQLLNYPEQWVTIQINPNIQDYKEQADKPGIKVRQQTFSIDQNKEIRFDFEKNNIQNVTIDGVKYKIKLMTIGKEQGFFYSELFITTLDP